MKDYKKILEGVVDIISTTEKSDIGFANICTYIGENCPELKESEDEKISREITEFILTHRIDEPNDIEDTNSWLAWLEKQGEKKSVLDELEMTLSVSEDAYLRSNLEKLIKELKNGTRRKTKLIEMSEVDDFWTEEDKSKVEDIVYYLDTAKVYYASTKVLDDCITWIKSLKQKIGWKPNKKQMQALHDLNLVGNISHVEQGQLLIELYNDLKKLIT